MNTIEVEPLLDQLTDNLKNYLSGRDISKYHIVGIRKGGVWIAEKLKDRLATPGTIGEIDISFYRDDFTQMGLNPTVRPSHIPFAVDGQHIILVDDVIQTGRTIKAALETLFEYGRPASVVLACLVELAGRELPIRADAVGRQFDASEIKRVKLLGPEPLQIQRFTV